MAGPVAERFNMYVSTLEHGRREGFPSWSGRPLHFEECLQEIKQLYDDYCHGNFDPFLTGKPLDPHKPNDWLIVDCYAVPTRWEFSHTPQFGFDTCKDHDLWHTSTSPFTIKKPFYIKDLDHAIPDAAHIAFHALSYKLWKKAKEEGNGWE